MEQPQNKKGFVRLIIVILVALIVLAYLGYDIRAIILSPAVTKVFSLIWDLLRLIFNLFVTVISVSWDTIISSLEYLTRAVKGLNTLS